MGYSIHALVSQVSEFHVFSVLVATCASIVFIVLYIIGNGHPSYGKYARVGKGLLEPWLRWEPPTRWRLDDCEAEGYQKVSKSEDITVLYRRFHAFSQFSA